MRDDLHPDTAAALALGGVAWAVLCMLTFRSETRWLWSGTGPLTVAGQVYDGTGDLGTIGEISEGADGKAEGTSVALSGVDPLDLAEAMEDVKQGAPGKLWFALLNPDMTVIGAPYLWFSGYVDAPAVTLAAEQISIALPLESQLAQHERANNLTYSTADQRLLYPDDTGFFHVERLNDQALRWGS